MKEIRYLPLRGRCSAATSLLVAYAAMDAISCGIGVYERHTGKTGLEEPTALDLVLLVFYLAMLVVLVATPIAYCMWLYRARRNIIAVGVPGLAYSPGLAVGSFFIPFVNLVVPFRAMKEAWKATEPPIVTDSDNWKHSPVPPLLGIWWALYLISNMAAWATLRIPPEADPTLATTAEAVSSALFLAAAALAISVVRGLTRRIEAAYETAPA